MHGRGSLVERPQRERSGHRMAPLHRGLRALLEDEQPLVSDELGQNLSRGSVCSPSCGGHCPTPPQLLEDEQLLTSGKLGRDLF